jgi:hypothetical protein
MKDKEEEVEFDLVLYGWTGELSPDDHRGGKYRVVAPKDSLLWNFLADWVRKRPEIEDHFFDPDREDFWRDVFVTLNGRYLSRNENPRVSQGDSVALIRVAEGG